MSLELRRHCHGRPGRDRQRDRGRRRLDGGAPGEQRLRAREDGAEVEDVQGAAEALALRLLLQVRLLEALGERAARAEDQRLDGGLGDLELRGDRRGCLESAPRRFYRCRRPGRYRPES
jgi:hypothetical protein